MLLKLRRPYIDMNIPRRGLRLGLHRLRAICAAVQSRRALARMDARMLSDIGLSRSEAEAEINRKPWDIAPR